MSCDEQKTRQIKNQFIARTHETRSSALSPNYSLVEPYIFSSENLHKQIMSGHVESAMRRLPIGVHITYCTISRIPTRSLLWLRYRKARSLVVACLEKSSPFYSVLFVVDTVTMSNVPPRVGLLVSICPDRAQCTLARVPLAYNLTYSSLVSPLSLYVHMHGCQLSVRCH